MQEVVTWAASVFEVELTLTLVFGFALHFHPEFHWIAAREAVCDVYYHTVDTCPNLDTPLIGDWRISNCSTGDVSWQGYFYPLGAWK